MSNTRDPHCVENPFSLEFFGPIVHTPYGIVRHAYTILQLLPLRHYSLTKDFATFWLGQDPQE